jgi:hypothetical protein
MNQYSYNASNELESTSSGSSFVTSISDPMSLSRSMT